MNWVASDEKEVEGEASWVTITSFSFSISAGLGSREKLEEFCDCWRWLLEIVLVHSFLTPLCLGFGRIRARAKAQRNPNGLILATSPDPFTFISPSARRSDGKTRLLDNNTPLHFLSFLLRSHHVND